MFTWIQIRRLAVPTLACGLLGFAVVGCSDRTATSTAVETLELTSTLTPLTAVSQDDAATATVKPADPTAAVATMTAPALSAAFGQAVGSVGEESQLEIEMGPTRTVSGSLPLVEEGGRVASPHRALLPAGPCGMRLSPRSHLEVFPAALLGLAGPRGVRVSGFDLRFDVQRGVHPTWTLPTTFKLNLERHKRMYVLKDAFMILRWQSRLSVPPADGKVTVTANLYNGQRQVAGPLTQTATVVDGEARFAGHSEVEFNGVDIAIDLRDQK
jgi:hypothetical protein